MQTRLGFKAFFAICCLALIGLGWLSKEVDAATNITSNRVRNQVWDASGSPYYLPCDGDYVKVGRLRIESAAVYPSPGCQSSGLLIEGTVSIYNSTIENVQLRPNTDLDNVTQSNLINCPFSIFVIPSPPHYYSSLTVSIQTSRIQPLTLDNYNTGDNPVTFILQDCEVTGAVAIKDPYAGLSSFQLIRTFAIDLNGSLSGDNYTEFQFTDSIFFWNNDASASLRLEGNLFSLSGCEFLAGTGADVSLLWYYSFQFEMLGCSLEGFQNGLQLHFINEGPPAEIHQCKFQNNLQYNLIYDSHVFVPSEEFLNATLNWWGSDDPDVVEASIKTVGDGPVYYLPFLESPP